jgi:hypothetical protein
MSDENSGSIVEAPAIGVRKEFEKLKDRFDLMEQLNHQHTAAMIDFTKAHNGHVISSQKTINNLAKVLDEQQKDIRSLKDQIDMIITKMQENGTW